MAFSKGISVVVAGIVFALWEPTPPAMAQDASGFTMARPASSGTDADPQVVGGEPVRDPDVWPATFQYVSANGGLCTATAVGPRVILTAAHCLGGRTRGAITVGDASIEVTCTSHPRFRFVAWAHVPEVESPDFALCSTAQELKLPVYETISTALADARVGEDVILLGNGCSAEGATDHGVLRQGQARVVKLPEPSVGDLFRMTEGANALCPGDSGGAMFFERRSCPKIGCRVIIGVNAQVNFSNLVSYFADVTTREFFEWADQWAGEAGLAICGVHARATGCRRS